MKSGRSLRFRLFAYAAIVVAAALLVTGISLSALSLPPISSARVGQELDTHLSQLTAGLRLDSGSALSLGREPVDPRFQAVFGRFVLQVDDETTATQLKSRSLLGHVPRYTRLTYCSRGETHVHDTPVR